MTDKIIFLDIDGVLKTSKKTDTLEDIHKMDHEKVSLYMNIVKNTGAKTVLSSDWRWWPNWSNVMADNGLMCDFLGRTGFEKGEHYERGVQISMFLAENNLFINKMFPKSKENTMRNYVILDDTDEFFDYQKSHVFLTKEGLTKEISEKIIAYLNA